MSNELKQVLAAFVKAQAEFKPAVLDKKNPHFNSKYASLTSVMDSVREGLAKNGLAVTQAVVDGKIVTRLIHSSGETLETSVPLLVSRQDMQSLGSALTYGRRYGLSALLGIVTDDDDDGNGADDKDKKEHREKKAALVITPKAEAKVLTTGNQSNEAPQAEYKIDFGKHNGATLREIYELFGKDELTGYVEFLENAAAKDNKQVMGKAKKFIDEVSAFIAHLENAPIEEGNFDFEAGA